MVLGLSGPFKPLLAAVLPHAATIRAMMKTGQTISRFRVIMSCSKTSLVV